MQRWFGPGWTSRDMVWTCTCGEMKETKRA
jgi:hypothetical protein